MRPAADPTVPGNKVPGYVSVMSQLQLQPLPSSPHPTTTPLGAFCSLFQANLDGKGPGHYGVLGLFEMWLDGDPKLLAYFFLYEISGVLLILLLISFGTTKGTRR